MSIFDRIKARLIDDWTKAWKYWSVQISILGAALSAAWAALPADTRAMIPGAQWIGLALFVMVLVTRLIQQKKPDGQ